MQIPIIVETLGPGQFRAEAPAPFSLMADGNSSDEAVQNLRLRIEQEFSRERRIVVLDLPVERENPLIRFSGHLKDESFLGDFQQALADYRRARDPDDE